VRVGILHTSGSSAATLVNKIDDDVAKWWLSTEVQLARTNFAEKFANFSPDWKNQWQQEFSRLLNS
jgi:putative transferase (TIGR04331 family)